MTEDNLPPDETQPDESSSQLKHRHIPEVIIKDLKEAGQLVRTGKKQLSLWLHSAIGAGTLLVLIVLFLAWYTNTAQFSTFVRERVETSISTATGGRVSLGSFQWSMWHRTILIDDLTIHGLEAPGQAPYIHVDHINAQLRWTGFFFNNYVYLQSLSIVRPSIHLMVAADGTTNQPHPPHPLGSLQQTLLDLAVSNISVEQGLAVINTQSIPIDFVARNTTVKMQYIAALPTLSNSASTDPNHAEHYTADFSSDDVHTRTYDEAQVASQLSGHFTFSANNLSLDKFSWHTPLTQLNATFNLINFSHPRWNANITGTVDLHQVAAITGIDGFHSGIVHLDLVAHSCDLARTGPEVAASRKVIYPHPNKPRTDQPGCTEPFLITGELTGTRAAWQNSIVTVETATASTHVNITPHEMEFLDMHATLADGASGRGDMHLFNYIGTAPLRGILDAQVAAVPLHNVIAALTPPQYSSLQYNTAATGDVHVLWSDKLNDADVHGTLQLQPVPNAPGVPISGTAQAFYTGTNSVVRIQALDITTPQSSLNVYGALGVVAPGMFDNPLTSLHADLTTRDLGEFDSLLHTFNVPKAEYSTPKDPAVPALLHGTAEFHGIVSGPMHQLDLRGHFAANQVDLIAGNLMPPSPWVPYTVHLDAISADLDLSATSVLLQQLHLQRGDSTLDLSGQLHPEITTRPATPSHPHPASTFVWTKNSTLDLTLRSQNFPIAALLSAPVTGALTANAHVTGSLNNLHADGHLDSRNGTLGSPSASEPYTQISANLAADNNLWSLNKISVTLPAGKLTGDAAYNFTTSFARWDLHTAALSLDHLHSIPPSTGLIGQLALDASGNGTPAAPGIQASFTLRNLALEHQTAGKLTATLHSTGHNLFYDLQSDAFGGHLQATGQTSLDPGYNTRLNANFAALDLAPLLQLSRFKITGHSEVGGDLSLSGPLADPAKLTGNASLSRFHIELSGVALDAAEPLHLSMAANALHLDQVHITGPDTNIRLQGVANFANAGDLRLHSDGNVNLKLLQTFDPDLLSTGQVSFSLNATGALLAPDYVGTVHINNAALALIDFPNGLSQINGTLDFNRDRLELRQLTAMTGGGQLSLGGAINLRGGIYADITAKGHDNRIRYPQGVSSTADTDLRLQGSPSNALLSGNVVITRFGLNQQFDIANAALTSSGVTPPPDPNAPSSHLRLDVHVTSAPQLDFQNSFAKLAGDVDLNLRGTVSSPSVLGRINISEGSASFAGTHYQLQSGNVTFTNPVHIEPLINLDATARVRDYDVYITLHGALTNLRPNYRSEPPLPQSDILALLALGRTQEQAQIYQQQQQQGADTTDNTLLGGALNQTVSNRAQRLFGVGSVKLDPTFVGTLGNSSARITVEQSVARDVTVTYATNVNQTAEQLIQVTWDLTHNVSLVSQRDENGVFSMTFKIRQRRK